MSEEPNPPPLRLKPRLKPDEPAAETPAPSNETPAHPVSEPSVENETPKLRLKPRLTLDPEPEKKPVETSPAPAESNAEAKPTEESPPVGKLRLKPKLTLEPDPAPKAEAAAEPVAKISPPASAPPPPVTTESQPPEPTADQADSAPKFKLKPKPAPIAPPPVAATGTPPAPPAPPPGIKLKPASTPAANPTASPSVETSPPLAPAAPPADTAAPETPPSPPEEDKAEPSPVPPKKRRRPGKQPMALLILGVLVLILGVGGYFAWTIFMAPPPPVILQPRPAVAKPAPPPEPEPAAEPAAPASLAGQLIEKTKGIAAAHDANLTDPVDQIMETETPVPPAPEESKVIATSQSQIAPGVTATTTTMLTAVQASREFENFVAEMRINGVFQGSPARALINGHTVAEGEMVDNNLGIIFDHIEADDKLIIFRDGNGATVRRKY